MRKNITAAIVVVIFCIERVEEVLSAAQDVYTNPQVMAWMMDEFAKLKGHNEFGVITGKPIIVGGWFTGPD
ncbi:hypothetical protein [Metallumcola ferriviriculae]|uniref:hypothetical protein n=1 Tax=Metallumcola ferriviriculae TaxID=3039180 RepID=UPI003458D7AC